MWWSEKFGRPPLPEEATIFQLCLEAFEEGIKVQKADR